MKAQMSTIEVEPVVDFTTAKWESDASQPLAIVVNSTAHIHITMGSCGVGWWAGEVEADLTVQIMLLTIVAKNRRQFRKAA